MSVALMLLQELRVECYRVSYLATGHAPMPVTPESATWDTIPPFYSPFVQEGPEVDGVGSGVSDVTMSENVGISLPQSYGPFVHMGCAERFW